MLKFIDSHTHLYVAQFNTDRIAVVQRAIENGISKMLLPNIDCASLDDVLNLSATFPDICLPMIGLHPCSVDADYEKHLKTLENRLGEISWAGIGETGTDLYWDKQYEQEQIKAFEIQINWAKSLNLPVVIHSRETLEMNIQLIKKHQNGTLEGVFHCFTGTYDQAMTIKDLGFFIGIGGILTFKNSSLAGMIKDIPLDFVLLETDAPYLTPVPYRGKRNESSHLRFVAEKLSEIKEIPIEEVALQTTSNAMQLFEI